MASRRRRRPDPELAALIRKAARLRARCGWWRDVAAEVGRSYDRVRHWPNEYPSIWNPEFRRELKREWERFEEALRREREERRQGAR